MGGAKCWRPRPELNWGTRICSPLRHHSATWPHAVPAPTRSGAKPSPPVPWGPSFAQRANAGARPPGLNTVADGERPLLIQPERLTASMGSRAPAFGLCTSWPDADPTRARAIAASNAVASPHARPALAFETPAPRAGLPKRGTIAVAFLAQYNASK